MALKLLNTSGPPLGQFDGYDTEITLGAGGIKGGEVATLVSIPLGPAVDLAAKDADGSDGYVNQRRPVVTKNLPDGARPVFLTDDGASGYGTLFGELVGATVGQTVTGAQLGPHTGAGSGKITLWGTEGLYASTLDAVDTTSGTGLTTDNTTLDVGDPLYATATGLLTPNVAASFDSATLVVGRFVEFSTNGSLVNTPNYLVSATNSPSGSLGSPSQLQFTQAVFHFEPEY